MTLFKLAPFAYIMPLLESSDLSNFVAVDPYTRTITRVDALDPADRETLVTWTPEDQHKPVSAALEAALAARECDAMCCGKRHGAVWKPIGTYVPTNNTFRVRLFGASCASAYKVRRHAGGVLRLVLGSVPQQDSMGVVGRCAVAATVCDPAGKVSVLPLEPGNISMTWANCMEVRSWLTKRDHVLRSPRCVACGMMRASHVCPRCCIAWYCSAECMEQDVYKHASCKMDFASDFNSLILSTKASDCSHC